MPINYNSSTSNLRRLRTCFVRPIWLRLLPTAGFHPHPHPSPRNRCCARSYQHKVECLVHLLRQYWIQPDSTDKTALNAAKFWFGIFQFTVTLKIQCLESLTRPAYVCVSGSLAASPIFGSFEFFQRASVAGVPKKFFIKRQLTTFFLSYSAYSWVRCTFISWQVHNFPYI